MGKYTDEAGQYQSMVSSNISKINDISARIGRVDSELKFDAESARDILTYKVAVCSDEIKSELDGLVSDLGNYSSLVYSKAQDLDYEESLNSKDDEDEDDSLTTTVDKNATRTNELF